MTSQPNDKNAKKWTVDDLARIRERHAPTLEKRKLTHPQDENPGDSLLVLVGTKGIYYKNLPADQAPRFIAEHLVDSEVFDEGDLVGQGGEAEAAAAVEDVQEKAVLRNGSLIDPKSIEEYIATDGYQALANALAEQDPARLIGELKQSGLQSRSGSGGLIGDELADLRNTSDGARLIVCNAGEGDPGAIMDRSILKGDPHSLLEGMAIAGFIVGASRGRIHVSAEYELAIERLEEALLKARRRGLLGEKILGFDFDFDIELLVDDGTGAGDTDTPTILNDVSAWANVPAIVLKGADWFTRSRAARGRKTKIFALAGRVSKTGLSTVPQGVTLSEVLGEIGGEKSKYPLRDSLPGGLIVLDDSTCMVELARSFMEFLVKESCGKCPPCRIGTQVMLNILTGITRGEGKPEDLETLTRLSKHIQRTTICGLAHTAPNVVLSTLKQFRKEYEAHINEKRCSASYCKFQGADEAAPDSDGTA